MNKFLITILIVMTISSCTEYQEENFELTILTDQIIKKPGNPIPEDLNPLFIPIKDEQCGQRQFRAHHATIYRHDLNTRDSMILEIKPGGLEKMFGRTTMNESDVVSKLENLKLTSGFSKPKETDFQPTRFKKILDAHASSLIIQLNCNGKETSVLDSAINLKAISEIAPLLVNYFCSENRADKKVLLLYNVVIGKGDGGPDKGPLYRKINEIANNLNRSQNRCEKSQTLYETEFSENAKVIEYSPEGLIINGTNEGFPLAKDWLHNLCMSKTIKSVKISGAIRGLNGKIEELKIVEFHEGLSL